MTFAKYKYLTKTIQTDEILRDKVVKISTNLKYGGYKKGLASMVFMFLDKKSTGCGIAKLANESVIKSMPNQQLANELQKPIISKLKKNQIYSSIKDNICGVDLTDMQLISKYNKRIKYLLSVIDFFSKYARVVPLKHRKRITIVSTFQSISNSSKRKPHKIWLTKVVNFIS